MNVGTFLTVRPVRTLNRGGMTAPMPGQSDNLGIPVQLLQGIPCGRGQDTDAKTTQVPPNPHRIGVTGAWHSLHSSVCKPKVPKPAATRRWEAAPVTARRMSHEATTVTFVRWADSSVRESDGLLSRRSGVQIPLGP